MFGMFRITKRLIRFPLWTRAFSDSTNQLESSVLTKIDSHTGYATVVLNRAPVNALNLELLVTLGSTIDYLELEKARGIILTSFSNKVFCAGLDIREMIAPSAEGLRIFWIAVQNLWIKLYGTSIPTVAVLNGHAPAGGCMLAIACEYRVMCPNFTIGLNETALGIAVPQWLQTTMRNTIGMRQAEFACTTGKLYSSQQALEIGLVDELATDEREAMKKAIGFLDRFKEISSQARSKSKLLLRKDDFEEFKYIREKVSPLHHTQMLFIKRFIIFVSGY
ncbi:enoyl-CoA delta isomerase 1, mitochondrial-like [Malaya genurostris]|uniref:enoyl-CoA delta isomerase 1, mitochondrial-like n=1 Tax=Malaya genurostris TaxID=325434 RepID=UPI0026F38BE0|nr:enoyl-CoA delta isomerase 1, mitochondrial-like [Malaya genurostris]